MLRTLRGIGEQRVLTLLRVEYSRETGRTSFAEHSSLPHIQRETMEHGTEVAKDGVDDYLRVSMPGNRDGLVAVEFPLAIKPTEAGTKAALAVIGGIEELTRVAADEVW